MKYIILPVRILISKNLYFTIAYVVVAKKKDIVKGPNLE